MTQSRIDRIAQYTTATLFGIIACSLYILSFSGTAQADTLNRQLQVGMSGTDVSLLQSYLAQDVTLYPQGLVTSYFGFLTKAAVSNFQSRNGIEAVGRVGPITLVALNARMSGSTSVDKSAPILSSVSISTFSNSAAVQWNTNELANGKVMYSTTYPSLVEMGSDVLVSGTVAQSDLSLKIAHNVSLNTLTPNTTYYYVIYTKDSAGNVQVTWPATFKTTN